jgi:hypothetical protein
MMFRALVIVGALAALASSLSAQQPLSVGTATSLGDAAVTEGRRTEATWNPALAGIYDGPVSSFSMLGLDIASTPARRWIGPAQRLGVDGIPPSIRWLGGFGPSGSASVGAGGVQWLASQHREYALTISSQYVATAAVPNEVAQALGGDSAAVSPLAGDSAVRAVATVASLARGAYAGRLPVLGRLWFGASIKGWWLHSYARGAFDAGGDAYEEMVLQDVPGYGVDAGFVAAPADGFRVAASVTNVFAGVVRPKRGPRLRTVSLATDSAGAVVVNQVYGPYLGREDDGTEAAGAAQRMWEDLSFPSVLRAGISFRTGAGTIAAAARSTLRDGGLDPEWLSTPYTVAYAGPEAFPVRVSVGGGGSVRAGSLGVRLGSCRRRWEIGVVRRTASWGSTLGASASLSMGSKVGCDAFRS